MTTAGYPLSVAAINQRIGQLATQQADLAAAQAKLLAALAALGADDDARRAALAALATGTLTDPAGWAADALYKAQVLNTLAQVYYGHATQPARVRFQQRPVRRARRLTPCHIRHNKLNGSRWGAGRLWGGSMWASLIGFASVIAAALFGLAGVLHSRAAPAHMADVEGMRRLVDELQEERDGIRAQLRECQAEAARLRGENRA